MDELLDRFLRGTDEAEVEECGRDLAVRNDAADVPWLLAALRDPLEARRLGAVYALGFSRRDRRAVVPLMNVLLDRTETAAVRGQAAECLGMLGQRRAIKALIRCSRDPSPDVRFWCVFGLGQITALRRKKLTHAGIRALEARLGDMAVPQATLGYWPIHFEALAMLGGLSARHAGALQQQLQHVLSDPVSAPQLWRWADFYASDTREAALKIAAAGYDPATFGRPHLEGGPRQ